MDMVDADPKGLIREAFAIEGITAPECRSILLDWALSLRGGDVSAAAIAARAHYGAAAPDHPMTDLLAEAAATPPAPRRRGGRAARVGGG